MRRLLSMLTADLDIAWPLLRLSAGFGHLPVRAIALTPKSVPQMANARGKLFGVGVAIAVAATGGRDDEHAAIRSDAGGGVTLLTGRMDHGQGHGTTYNEILLRSSASIPS